MKISAERGEGYRYHQVEIEIAKLETSQAASGSTPTNQSSRSNSATKVSLDDWFQISTQFSKAVNENGEPLVVYHGTADDFDTFDLDHPNRNDTGCLVQAAI